MTMEYAAEKPVKRIGEGATCAKALEGYKVVMGQAMKMEAGDPAACTEGAIVLRPGHGEFWLTWCREGHLMLTTVDGAVRETLELSESLPW